MARVDRPRDMAPWLKAAGYVLCIGTTVVGMFAGLALLLAWLGKGAAAVLSLGVMVPLGVAWVYWFTGAWNRRFINPEWKGYYAGKRTT